MININDLNEDIIFKISKWLSIKDICILQKTSRDLYCKINILQDNILTLHFAKFKTNFKRYKLFMYNFIQNALIAHLYNFKWDESEGFNESKFKNMLLNNNYYYKFYNSNFDFQKNYLHKLTLTFNKIFYFFVKNDYVRISTYPNKFELYALYAFFQIHTYKNKIEFNILTDFLESINKVEYNIIRNRYYNSVLDTFHTNVFRFTFDQIYAISNTVISVPIFKKLMGCKILDLSESNFNACCHTCNEDLIIEICNYKMMFWKDSLISHNYLQFKNVLYKHSKYYYQYIINIENRFLNDKIYIKNPITNRRMRINGNYYKNTMINLYKTDYQTYNNLFSKVKRLQNLLRRRFFD